MAELVDAHDSGSCVLRDVRVQVPFLAVLPLTERALYVLDGLRLSSWAETQGWGQLVGEGTGWAIKRSYLS